MKKAGKVVKLEKNSLYGKLASKHAPITVRETKHFKEFKMRFPRFVADRMDSNMQEECLIHNIRNMIAAQGMSEPHAMRVMLSMAITDALHFAPEEQVVQMVADADSAARESIKICGCKYEAPPVHRRN